MSDSSTMLVNGSAIVIAVAITAALAVRRIRTSELWRATVTPLASIIGSGFLIIAPLLHSITGRWSLAVIVVLSLFSYAIGTVLRFNIKFAEPWAKSHTGDFVRRLEVTAQLVLGMAYAISVAFYTSLFVSFLYERVSFSILPPPAVATTLVLSCIAMIAWNRGTRGLETIELTAVTVKLAIIGGLLFALALYDIQTGIEWFSHSRTAELSAWDTMAVLAGMLMVTQGFETTRFTGNHYAPGIRILAARNAQLIAIAIYIAFIGLTCPIFLEYPITELTETAISKTLGQAVVVLPLLLFVAATASQLSAALADTIGGGGLLAEASPIALSEKHLYALLAAAAILIVWSTDVFGIINLASKGFALFYLLQVLIAARLLMAGVHAKTVHTGWGLAGCGVLAGLLLFVILFSRPAPHA